MAKMNFLKKGEKSKKPEYLAYVKQLENELNDLKQKVSKSEQNLEEVQKDYSDLELDLIDSFTKCKKVEKEHNISRIINAILFISHSILAYIHFRK